jgi:hypothetical protein
MALPSIPPTMDLEGFLSFLFEETEGYVYVATKDPKLSQTNPKFWIKYFFRWPNEQKEIINHVNKYTGTHEVYIAPSLFKRKGCTKDDWAGTHVVWTEFDGGIPDLSNKSCPNPTLRVCSSTTGYEHWYWKIQSYETSCEIFEDIAKRISYGLEGDTSTWNCNRVLRPIHSYHHESKRRVSPIHFNNNRVQLDDFRGLPKPPDGYENIVVPSDIPDVNTIILRYKWSDPAIKLLRDRSPKDRSTSLSQLAHFCAEMGMQNNEIMAVLLNADERWKKFIGRRDRQEQLSLIIANARKKHPQEDKNKLLVLGSVDFIKQTPHTQWVIEGLLPLKSMACLTSKAGTGKTQIALQLGIHLALGKSFTKFNIPAPIRSVFFSLDMPDETLRDYVETMYSELTEAELKQVNENFLIMPLGQKLHLDKGRDQQKVAAIISEWEPQGIWVDTLTKCTAESTNNDEAMERVFDFFKEHVLVNRAFVFGLHHFRKPSSGSKKSTEDLYDVRGAGVIGDNVNLMLSAKSIGKDIISIETLKTRAPRLEPFRIKRTENLNFVEMREGGINSNAYRTSELAEAQDGLSDSI